MVLVCDIDGTLAKTPPERLAAADRHDWCMFYSSDFTHDEPVAANINQVDALVSEGWVVYFVTSRRECVRYQTLLWLFANIPSLSPKGMKLVMRSDDDAEQDPGWKVRTVREVCPKATSTVVWDDRADVCAELASLGYVCHHVQVVR